MRLIGLAAMFFLIALMPLSVSAEMPDISAGETHFDIANGCYILKNNVRVVARGRTMTAHEAKVSLTTRKVWARGDVTLIQDGIKFNCDSIYVQGTEKTVDVLGNVFFEQEQLLKITSDIAKFSWGTKVADFYGKVSINVEDAKKLKFGDGVDKNSDLTQPYDHIQYNVVEKKILLLEIKESEPPKVNLPELRIEIE